MEREERERRSPIPRRWMTRRAFSSSSGIRVDRRSGIDRRRSQRRSVAMAMNPDRRTGVERRSWERRGGIDRRGRSDRRALTDRRRTQPSMADIASHFT